MNLFVDVFFYPWIWPFIVIHLLLLLLFEKFNAHLFRRVCMDLLVRTCVLYVIMQIIFLKNGYFFYWAMNKWRKKRNHHGYLWQYQYYGQTITISWNELMKYRYIETFIWNCLALGTLKNWLNSGIWQTITFFGTSMV